MIFEKDASVSCYDNVDMPRRKATKAKSKTVIAKLEQKPVRFRFRREKSAVEKLADAMTSFFGTLAFLLSNLIFFVVWIIWNLELHPSFTPFDPYPFGMLTMIVSLEAIVLSIVVLISQNRANVVADAREEIDFEVDVASERQIAAVMQSLDLILHRLDIQHREDERAMEPVNVQRLERRIIDEIDTD